MEKIHHTERYANGDPMIEITKEDPSFFHVKNTTRTPFLVQMLVVGCNFDAVYATPQIWDIT